MTTALVDPAPPARTGGTATELCFPNGLPGFPTARRFRVERWGGDDSPFLAMTCTQGAEARFVIAKPQVFFPHYLPEVGDDVCATVGLADATRASLWVILTLGTRPEEATANLLAPLVVNADAGLAAQAVQPGRRWSARTPLVAAAA